MRSINQNFYRSKQWKECRAAYLSQHSLCERCLAKGRIVPADIVHHKIYLTNENLYDPSIALNFDNLEAVCRGCHNDEHFGDKTSRRWRYDDGVLILDDDSENV